MTRHVDPLLIIPLTPVAIVAGAVCPVWTLVVIALIALACFAARISFIAALLILVSTPAMGQGFGTFTTDQPFLAAPPLTIPGDIFLWVDATDVLGTNSPMQNGDVWTNVVDKGYLHHSTDVSIGIAQRFFNDGSGGLANGVPFCRQTNSGASGGGINGGFGVPPGWMAATDTNFTILMVCKNEAGSSVPTFVEGELGTSSSGFYIHARNGGPALETHLITSQGAAGTFTTNIWRCLTFVQSNAFLFVYTNGVLITGPVGGTPSAFGSAPFTSAPRFFGQRYTGNAVWVGDWCRVMMWRRPLFGYEKAYWENRAMTDFGTLPGP
jgi:hypothetical protein